MKRFWSKVDVRGQSECWEWLAGRCEQGYGNFKGVESKAHRMAWTLTNGPIPEGLKILHRCDNPPCVNPAHLFVGTQADNVADMCAKGRRVQAEPLRGEAHPRVRLSAAQALEIKTSSEASTDLANRFGLHKTHVNDIKAGRRWACLDEEAFGAKKRRARRAA